MLQLKLVFYIFVIIACIFAMGWIIYASVKHVRSERRSPASVPRMSVPNRLLRLGAGWAIILIGFKLGIIGRELTVGALVGFPAILMIMILRTPK